MPLDVIRLHAKEEMRFDALFGPTVLSVGFLRELIVQLPADPTVIVIANRRVNYSELPSTSGEKTK